MPCTPFSFSGTMSHSYGETSRDTRLFPIVRATGKEYAGGLSDSSSSMGWLGQIIGAWVILLAGRGWRECGQNPDWFSRAFLCLDRREGRKTAKHPRSMEHLALEFRLLLPKDREGGGRSKITGKFSMTLRRGCELVHMPMMGEASQHSLMAYLDLQFLLTLQLPSFIHFALPRLGIC